MAHLQTIWVIHTTSRREDAGTDDSFFLELPLKGKAGDSPIGQRIPFPNLPHDEREAGRTDEYRFDVRQFRYELAEVRGQIRLVTRGDDGWLPQSIWVIGQTADGRFHLLAAKPGWPSNGWFSTDSSEGRASYRL